MTRVHPPPCHAPPIQSTATRGGDSPARGGVGAWQAAGWLIAALGWLALARDARRLKRVRAYRAGELGGCPL